MPVFFGRISDVGKIFAQRLHDSIEVEGFNFLPQGAGSKRICNTVLEELQKPISKAVWSSLIETYSPNNKSRYGCLKKKVIDVLAKIKRTVEKRLPGTTNPT